MSTVYLGLGSNINGPVQQLECAIRILGQQARCKILALSSFYSNPPMGPAQQPDYVNAVVCIDTDFSPGQLMDNLQAIEMQQGRKRGVRWGPRCLDIDILLYEQISLDSERLKIPHPGLCERNFVLYPLQEIAPDLNIPGKGHIIDLIKDCDYGELRKLQVDMQEY